MQPHDQAAPDPSNKLSYSEMGRRGWDKRPLVTYACQLCGKERQTKTPKLAKWCSNTCNWKAHRDKGRYDRDRKCTVCGDAFRARPNRGKRFRESCSLECRNTLVARKNAKLSPEAVTSIRSYGDEGKSQRWIAEKFRISQNVVSGILRGRSFKWVPGGKVLAPVGAPATEDALPVAAQAI